MRMFSASWLNMSLRFIINESCIFCQEVWERATPCSVKRFSVKRCGIVELIRRQQRLPMENTGTVLRNGPWRTGFRAEICRRRLSVQMMLWQWRPARYWKDTRSVYRRIWLLPASMVCPAISSTDRLCRPVRGHRRFWLVSAGKCWRIFSKKTNHHTGILKNIRWQSRNPADAGSRAIRIISYVQTGCASHGGIRSVMKNLFFPRWNELLRPLIWGLSVINWIPLFFRIPWWHWTVISWQQPEAM